VHGEYVNETVFLTHEDHERYLQLKAVEGSAQHLALFTDGIESVAIRYATGEPNPKLFEGLFKFVDDTPSDVMRSVAITRLLKGERIAERSDDDKTLLLATRCELSRARGMSCA
jgi:hypothetical protein